MKIYEWTSLSILHRSITKNTLYFNDEIELFHTILYFLDKIPNTIKGKQDKNNILYNLLTDMNIIIKHGKKTALTLIENTNQLYVNGLNKYLEDEINTNEDRKYTKTLVLWLNYNLKLIKSLLNIINTNKNNKILLMSNEERLDNIQNSLINKIWNCYYITFSINNKSKTIIINKNNNKFFISYITLPKLNDNFIKTFFINSINELFIKDCIIYTELVNAFNNNIILNISYK